MHARRFPALLALAALLLTPLGTALAQDASGAQEPPVGEDGDQVPAREAVYVLMRDMGMAWDTVQVETIVPNEQGASVLVRLQDGTLADVEVVPVTGGWNLRDVFYVAGDADSFRAWMAPWQRRVEDAERFVAASTDRAAEDVGRRARELAPLVWFEDTEESSRLWGLNPVTYRLMQTLKMMPAMGGPMDGGMGRR